MIPYTIHTYLTSVLWLGGGFVVSSCLNGWFVSAFLVYGFLFIDSTLAVSVSYSFWERFVFVFEFCSV